MDSKDVTKELEARVFPVLRQVGFSEFRGRAAWRDREHSIDLLDLRSVGYYRGSAIGATSHSFVASAGVYIKSVHAVPWADEPVPARPRAHDCHAQFFLKKPMFQLWCWRPGVWYVSKRGGNLEKVVVGLLRAISEEALPWLGQFADLETATRVFETRDESWMSEGNPREMFSGGLGSVARAEVVSALALSRGDLEGARAVWEAVLAEPYHQDMPDALATARQRLAAIGNT